MNTTLTAPNFPTVERFSRLLRSGGWEHRDDDAFTSLWTKTVDSRDFQIVLPLHDGTPDARTLLAEAVDTLAYSLKRSRTEVIEELAEPVEQILVHLHPQTPGGQAPVTLLESTVRGLRDVVVGAASALFTHTLVLPTRRPTLAEEFANSARVATGPGSFVVAMLLPLDGLDGEPMGRRVTDLLARFATEAHRISIHEGADWEDHLSAGDRRPNATVLGGLARIGGPEHLPYQLRILQSVARASPAAPMTLDFTPEQQAALAAAARYLRIRRPAHGTQVQGLVVRLTREGATGSGEAVVEGVYDDSHSVGRVTVPLAESDYEQAIWAHRLGRHVSMTGDLNTQGNRKYLDAVSGFTILAREET